MKSAIKIVKRNQDQQPCEAQICIREQSVEQSTREIVNTVKRWIVEVQQRKRAQVHSL
jgi:hypothetical protein